MCRFLQADEQLVRDNLILKHLHIVPASMFSSYSFNREAFFEYSKFVSKPAFPTVTSVLKTKFVAAFSVYIFTLNLKYTNGIFLLGLGLTVIYIPL